jgi:hypothetical protein
MQSPYNNTILQILRIVNYVGNKEKLIIHFEQLNYLEAIANLLERFAPPIQNEIKSAQNIQETMKKYIDPQEYVTELNTVSHNALYEFIEEIAHTLNPLQKQKIQETLATL